MYISCFFFFFNDTPTTEIYTLSLHDALPICSKTIDRVASCGTRVMSAPARTLPSCRDRKSTRLNSSHANISYAVFCLKKKKKRVNRRQVRCECESRLDYTLNCDIYMTESVTQ